PRIKRGFPPAIVAITVFLVFWLLVMLTIGDGIPQGLRQNGARVFYLGYLVIISLIWALLVGGILLAFFIPMAMIHDAFVHAHQAPQRRPRQPEMLAIFAFFLMLMIGGWLLPLWLLLGLCAAALIVNMLTTFLPANSSVQFLWRPRASIQVRSMRWSHWVSCEFMLITLAVFDLVLTACGPKVLLGEAIGRTAMPFTALLGTLLAWLAPRPLWAVGWPSGWG